MYGRCQVCNARAEVAYQPGSNPPKSVCINCVQPLPRHVTPPVALLDDYMTAAHNLAAIVRQAFGTGAKRREILSALETFERVDLASERSAD